MPYSLEMIGKAISGLPPFEKSSRADVDAAVAHAKGVASGGGSPKLPRVLTCAIGQLSRLVQLTIDAADVVVARKLPSPPESRPSHLMYSKATQDGFDCADFTVSGRIDYPRLACGTVLVAARAVKPDGEAAVFTLGDKAKPAATDPSITFYHVATDGGGGYVADRPTFDFDADRPRLDGTRTTLHVSAPALRDDGARGGPPVGFLVAFLSGEATDEPFNRQLVCELSLARSLVDDRCWGVQFLRPSPNYDAQWRAGASTTAEPPPPTYSDLAALQYEIAALPALLLISPNGHHPMVRISGRRELQAHGFVVGDGGRPINADGGSGGDASTSALASLLQRTAAESEESRRKHSLHVQSKQEMKLVPSFLGESSAEWIRMQGYRLLILNAEGTLKKPVNLAMPTAPSAGKGGHDAFYGHAVPLLRALLVAAIDDETVKSEGTGGGESGGSAAGILRHDAPRLALLSDLGHQCVERESGPLLEETKVRTVLSNLVLRLCYELQLSAAASKSLVATTSVYHSFTPMSKPEPTDKAIFHEPSRAGNEWSHDWCRPNAGALLQALQDAAVEASEALVVCVNANDDLAASVAGIASIWFQDLLGGAPAGQVRVPTKKGPRGGGVAQSGGRAPAAFVPGLR